MNDHAREIGPRLELVEELSGRKDRGIQPGQLVTACRITHRLRQTGIVCDTKERVNYRSPERN